MFEMKMDNKKKEKDGLITSMVKDTLNLGYRAWLNRRGNEIHYKVYNTIQELYGNDKLKPIILKVHSPIEACLSPKVWEVKKKIRETLPKIMSKEKFFKLKKKFNGKGIFDKPKPENQWEFVVHLPTTITFKKFKENTEVFARATGGEVDISYNFGKVIIRVMTKPLGTNYPFCPIECAKNMKLPFTLGYSAGGILVEDLADVVTVLVSGLPKMGKSVWLHNLVINLLLHGNVDLHIIDLKRGVGFGYLSQYDLCAKTQEEADRLLIQLNEEMDRRYDIFVEAKVVDIEKYHEKGFTMEYVVLIIDEISELETRESFDALRRLVKMGRAGGIFVVVATQKPSGAMHSGWTDTRDLFDGRMCFYVGGSADFSQVALGRGDLSGCNVPHIKGRAVWKYKNKMMFQSMVINPPDECEELLEHVLRGKTNEKHINPKKLLPPR